MTVYKTLCKDSKTGYYMVLSDVSYNKAVDWLEREMSEEGSGEITGIEFDGDLCIIHTFPFTDELTENEQRGLIGRNFFYDEERGYLLGE